MAFSPQDTARSMIQSLRSAHATADILATASGVMEARVVKDRVESICRSMNAAHDALNTLQTRFDNATIASRIANHLEPAPADLAAAYTTARQAWIAMADDYGTVVLADMGSPWTWDSANRAHQDALYDIDRTANFRSNIIALRDALAVFA